MNLDTGVLIFEDGDRMKVEFFETVAIAYRRRVGAYGVENKKLMEEVKCFLKNEGYLQEGSILIGIPRDNPEITVASNCRYDIGLILKPGDDFTEPTFIKEQVSAGNYLVLTIPHTEKEVATALPRLFEEMSKKGYQHDLSRPIIEKYAGNLLLEGQCEVCVPII